MKSVLFSCLVFFAMLYIVPAQKVTKEFVEDVFGYSNMPQVHCVTLDSNIYFFGTSFHKISNDEFQDDFNGIRLKYQNSGIETISKKFIDDDINNLLMANSMCWEEDNKINLISMVAMRSAPILGIYQYIYPQRYVFNSEFELLEKSIDTNNFQVVASGTAPPMLQIGNDSILVPVYGSDRFNKNTGLYFTYYDMDCKALGSKLLFALDTSNVKNIDSLMFVLSANLNRIEKLPDNSYILNGDVSYSIGSLSTGGKMVYDRAIIKLKNDLTLDWIKLNKDFSNENPNSLLSMKLFGDNLYVTTKSTTTAHAEAKNNAHLLVLDPKTGAIKEQKSFGELPFINSTNINITTDSSIIVSGHFIRPMGVGEEAQPKYYAAKFNKNLEFEWDIASTNIDPTTIRFQNCIELGNNNLMFYGHNDFKFLGVIMNQTSGVLDLRTNDNTLLKVIAERGTMEFITEQDEILNGANIKVYDVSGNLIVEGNLGSNSIREYKVESSNLVSGVYFLQINNSEFNINKKFIIE